MPFKSKAQQGFLFAKKPEVAAEFADKTPKSAYAGLPKKVKKKKKNMSPKESAIRKMAAGTEY